MSVWPGPGLELAYVRYVLADSHGGGGVEGGQLAGHLNIGPVRLGVGGEVGLRDFSLGDVDVVLRGEVRAGYQHLRGLGPVVPYVVAVGTYGVVVGKRFHTPFAHVLEGLGAELGLDLNVARVFFVGVGFGYLRARMQELGYDLLTMRLRVGL